MAASKGKSGHEDHTDGIVEDRRQAPPLYFQILFYGLILWGVIFCGYYLLSGWSSAQEFQEKMAVHNAAQQSAAPQNPEPTAKEPAAQTAGAAATTSGATDPAGLFTRMCAGCHGADGKGGVGPDLSGDYAFGKTPDAIKASIAAGRKGKMPGFGDQLSAAEIAALSGYLLNL
jgi:cytochrome c oxidase cbb3-type subunit 3